MLLLAWAFFLLRPDGAGAATRPSFVLIQLDDFANLHFDSRWVDSFGTTRRSMPLTRQELLARGVRFTGYQAPTPVCAPSRASLLSGRYAVNHGVRRVSDDEAGGWTAFRNNEIHDQNLAVWLQSGGYRTMQFGKFMNFYMEPDGYPTAVRPPGWDVWQADANDESTREFYGYSLNLNGTIGGPFGAADYGPGTEKDPEGCPELILEACNYHTDAITTRAIEQIASTPADQPLFAHLGYHTPHGDSRPPIGPEPAVRHYDSAGGTPRPNPPGYGERDVSDKPPWISTLPRPSAQRGAAIRTDFRKSIEALRSVDESVARIFDALEDTGRLDSTFVFLFSDNGFFHGEHRIVRGKSYPYEPAVQVPMLVRGPGVPEGRRSGELVANQDIAPTVLSLAGVGAGRPMDGRSMVRFWESPRTQSRRPILLDAYADLGQGTTEPTGGEFYTGIRVGPYKYVRYRSGDRELYDLSTDPHEERNRIGDPNYRRVTRYLKRQLDAYWGCAGAECRKPAPKWPLPGPR